MQLCSGDGFRHQLQRHIGVRVRGLQVHSDSAWSVEKTKQLRSIDYKTKKGTKHPCKAETYITCLLCIYLECILVVLFHTIRIQNWALKGGIFVALVIGTSERWGHAYQHNASEQHEQCSSNSPREWTARCRREDLWGPTPSDPTGAK